MKNLSWAPSRAATMLGSPDDPMPPAELVDCDPGNFGDVVRVGKKMTEEQRKGFLFVCTLGLNEGNWKASSGEVPWSSTAEQAVDTIVQSEVVTRQWLLGVMQALRSAKTQLSPRQLAAGFLILSRLTREKVREWLPGVDLSATCDGGCRMSDIVPQAANIARQNLGLA